MPWSIPAAIALSTWLAELACTRTRTTSAGSGAARSSLRAGGVSNPVSTTAFISDSPSGWSSRTERAGFEPTRSLTRPHDSQSPPCVAACSRLSVSCVWQAKVGRGPVCRTCNGPRVPRVARDGATLRRMHRYVLVGLGAPADTYRRHTWAIPDGDGGWIGWTGARLARYDHATKATAGEEPISAGRGRLLGSATSKPDALELPRVWATLSPGCSPIGNPPPARRHRRCALRPGREPPGDTLAGGGAAHWRRRDAQPPPPDDRRGRNDPGGARVSSLLEPVSQEANFRDHPLGAELVRVRRLGNRTPHSETWFQPAGNTVPAAPVAVCCV